MPPSQVALCHIYDVTTVQLSKGTVYTQKKILFMKMYRPSSFIPRYVRTKMIVHAFIIELDHLDY